MSYMRVVIQQIAPARVSEVMKLMDEVAKPALEKVPGCQSYVLSGDVASGAAVAVSVWETLEHANTGLTAILGGRPLQELGVTLTQTYVHEILREIKPAAA
jgi:hypothetical protein